MAIEQIQNGDKFSEVRQTINNNFQELSDNVDDTIDSLKSDGVVVFGTYTGDGAASRTINLGFTPVAVELCLSNGQIDSYGGLALRGYACSNGINASGSARFEIVTNGFKVYYDSRYGSTFPKSNMLDYTYYFIAYKVGTIVSK